jgi:hypothetical protein
MKYQKAKKAVKKAVEDTTIHVVCCAAIVVLIGFLGYVHVADKVRGLLKTRD